MAQKSISGNLKLAEQIKKRRNELNLTIEEAAKRAGVGTKTWSRYEAGESIRQDKYKGLCKALNWMRLPTQDDEKDEFNLEEYRKHEAWSEYLENNFGEVAALSFAVGSDILSDYIEEDLSELSKLPKGTHVGQLGASYLADILPEQFLMNYDYNFLYLMKTELNRLRKAAKFGNSVEPKNVLDELLLVLIMQESEFLVENDCNLDIDGDWKEWVYEINGDADIEMCLYSGQYVSEGNIYHFSHWSDE